MTDLISASMEGLDSPAPARVDTRVPQAPAQPKPMEILMNLLSRPDLDLDRMERLLVLQERWEAQEARKAFVAAMADFKRFPPVIVKDKEVDFTSKSSGQRVHYKHAELDQVAEKIGKALSAVGISHTWRPEQQGGKVRVTCVLTHYLGHSESVTLEGDADTSGLKNSIQAVGSAVTYLSRYTLLMATGLATGTEDNDGRPQEGPTVREDGSKPQTDLERYIQALETAPSIEVLSQTYHEAIRKYHGNQKAQGQIIGAKDARKKALGA